jgi:hypothetical protein
MQPGTRRKAHPGSAARTTVERWARSRPCKSTQPGLDVLQGLGDLARTEPVRVCSTTTPSVRRRAGEPRSMSRTSRVLERDATASPSADRSRRRRGRNRRRLQPTGSRHGHGAPFSFQK